MWYKNVGIIFFHFATIHAFDRQTDGQTDRHIQKGLGSTVCCITCSRTVKKWHLCLTLYTTPYKKADYILVYMQRWKTGITISMSFSQCVFAVTSFQDTVHHVQQLNSNYIAFQWLWTVRIYSQTSFFYDEIHHVLLTGSLQGSHKVVTLVLCCKQIQYSVTSPVCCSPVTANIIILPTTQHLQPQQFIQQPEVWLY